jgi:large subunit ribosomal protein L25
MASESKLVAETRTLSGSAAARRMRRAGWMPGIVNTDRGDAQMIRLNRHNFEMMLHHHASENLILDLAVDGGDARKVLLKEVQHDYVSGEPIHADFVEISMTKKMRINIALKFVGEPFGVSQEGGVLEHPVRQVEVECLPTDLVEEIEVDVTALKIGDSLLARDIKLDPKLTILTPGDVAVALVSAPHVEEVAAPVEAAVEGAEAAKEPEVIEKGKEKTEGEAEAAPAEKGEKAEKAEKAEKPEKKEKRERK